MEVDVMDNVFVKDVTEAPSSTVERAVQVSGNVCYHRGLTLTIIRFIHGEQG